MIPTVVRSSASPAIPATPGLVVTLAPRADLRSPIVVCGAFHLPLRDAEALGRPAHRGVVVVAWSLEHRYALAPLREQVLFVDDEVSLPGAVGGYFNVDLFELQGGPVPGDFHLYSSLGSYLSNVVRASVR